MRSLLSFALLLGLNAIVCAHFTAEASDTYHLSALSNDGLETIDSTKQGFGIYDDTNSVVDVEGFYGIVAAAIPTCEARLGGTGYGERSEIGAATSGFITADDSPTGIGSSGQSFAQDHQTVSFSLDSPSEVTISYVSDVFLLIEGGPNLYCSERFTGDYTLFDASGATLYSIDLAQGVASASTPGVKDIYVPYDFETSMILPPGVYTTVLDNFIFDEQTGGSTTQGYYRSAASVTIQSVPESSTFSFLAFASLAFMRRKACVSHGRIPRSTVSGKEPA